MAVETLLSALMAAMSSASASCYILTDSADVTCPLCGIQVKPNLAHACRRKGQLKTLPPERRAGR